jgi:hypothetical protein
MLEVIRFAETGIEGATWHLVLAKGGAFYEK